MIYKVREKFWALGADFSITDANDRECFTVDGKAFSFGDKLSLQDTSGREVAFIDQKLLSFKPRYKIIINGKKFAEVVKEWSWFNKKFTLDVPGPNDYEIEGSFWQHEFVFTRRGREVAQISKKLWSWSDAYGVNIVDGEDDIAILCTCIVIDQVLDDEQRNS